VITIQGQYNTAICYTNELEGAAREQIQAVCDRPEFAGCKIRIMPDVHAGKVILQQPIMAVLIKRRKKGFV